MKAIRSALVTGGARRIGRAIVEDLAAYGFAVAIHAHGSDREAETLAAALGRRGATAVVLKADLTRLDETEGLIDAAREAIGSLGLLINNASLFKDDSASEFDAANWDAHFAVHARAPVVLAQRFAAQRPEDAGALVVNIIDQRVWRLTPKFFSYTLSKATLWTATQTLAQGLAPHVRVNAIGPGPTLANERQSAADFEAQAAKIPLGRGPELSEFGRTIRYLVETPSITGQMIALDGGQHLAWQTPDNTDIGE
ncbi:MAG TPA: SDR family oxidoreductase [Pararhizobium sp.]|nr:SDR family oxidoreductase [Pararhizobium sp.]